MAMRAIEAADVQPNGVEIVALLADPAGRDEDHQEIKIGNLTDRPTAGMCVTVRARSFLRSLTLATIVAQLA